MHNRVGSGVNSFELERREAIAIVPILLVVLVFAFYPQFGLSRSQTAVNRSLAKISVQQGRPITLASVMRPRRIYTYAHRSHR